MDTTVSSGQPTVAVNGTTLLVPLLAYPSHHVRTPAIFNRYCVDHKIPALMMAWKVPPTHLASAMEVIRRVDTISGAVVTIPHKHEVAKFCDELEGAAKTLQVCNAVRKTTDGRLVGQILDGAGFVSGIKSKGIDPCGKSVILAGAGGAATAVAYELIASGIERIAILNRSRDKAEALIELLKKSFPTLCTEVNPTKLTGYDIAINGTSLGMNSSDPLPFLPEHLSSGTIVAEIVMQPDITPLLLVAAERGLRIHKGVHMVEAQVELLAQYTTASAAG